MRPGVRDLAVIIGIAWIARAAFVVAIGDTQAVDVDHWRGALAALDDGRNPYETGVLNWPPLWLMIIVSLDYVAGVVEIGFWSVLRIYLVLVESVLVVTLYATLTSFGAGRRSVRRALLAGVALNPVAIILVCQHGNSDVQVGLLVTLAVAALAAHERSRDIVVWLGGSLFLGLGILAKTVPLVLAPLLAPGARLASNSGRALGAVLFLGPAALAVAVIFVLASSEVWDHVIGYRATRGFFGLAGMLEESGAIEARFAVVSIGALGALTAIVVVWRARRPASPGAVFALVAATVIVAALWLVEAAERFTIGGVRERYDTAFTVGVVVAVALLGRRLWREEPPALPRLFLLAAVLLLAIVAFGPGYGPQYAYWFLPALVATYVLLDDGWRVLLRVAWIVGALTYAFEYAVVDYLGAWARAVFGDAAWVTDAGAYLSTPHHLVIYRLPLYVVYLLLIAAGIERLVARGEHEPAAGHGPGSRSETPGESLRSRVGHAGSAPRSQG